jgi:hypothetical protein
MPTVGGERRLALMQTIKEEKNNERGRKPDQTTIKVKGMRNTYPLGLARRHLKILRDRDIITFLTSLHHLDRPDREWAVILEYGLDRNAEDSVGMSLVVMKSANGDSKTEAEEAEEGKNHLRVKLEKGLSSQFGLWELAIEEFHCVGRVLE